LQAQRLGSTDDQMVILSSVGSTILTALRAQALVAFW
jgi:hypothetical protein